MGLTPQQAADIVEICQLKSAYSWHYDTPDLDALVDLFTDDAVCDFGPYGRWEGKAEIREGFKQNIKDPSELVRYVHNTTNPLIDVDGETAKGRWYLLDHVLNYDDKSDPMKIMAIYNEKYVKKDGSWKILHSHIEFVWTAENGRVKDALENKI